MYRVNFVYYYKNVIVGWFFENFKKRLIIVWKLYCFINLYNVFVYVNKVVMRCVFVVLRGLMKWGYLRLDDGWIF